jgi:hypothetical protein
MSDDWDDSSYGYDATMDAKTCAVRDHCFCTLAANRKTINCCRCTTAVEYGEPFQFQPVCRYKEKPGRVFEPLTEERLQYIPSDAAYEIRQLRAELVQMDKDWKADICDFQKRVKDLEANQVVAHCRDCGDLEMQLAGARSRGDWLRGQLSVIAHESLVQPRFAHMSEPARLKAFIAHLQTMASNFLKEDK